MGVLHPKIELVHKMQHNAIRMNNELAVYADTDTNFVMTHEERVAKDLKDLIKVNRKGALIDLRSRKQLQQQSRDLHRSQQGEDQNDGGANDQNATDDHRGFINNSRNEPEADTSNAPILAASGHLSQAIDSGGIAEVDQQDNLIDALASRENGARDQESAGVGIGGGQQNDHNSFEAPSLSLE